VLKEHGREILLREVMSLSVLRSLAVVIFGEAGCSSVLKKDPVVQLLVLRDHEECRKNMRLCFLTIDSGS
jgi:hypothetical protein